MQSPSELHYLQNDGQGFGTLFERKKLPEAVLVQMEPDVHYKHPLGH